MLMCMYKLQCIISQILNSPPSVPHYCRSRTFPFTVAISAENSRKMRLLSLSCLKYGSGV